jgi:hypothetical protein
MTTLQGMTSRTWIYAAGFAAPLSWTVLVVLTFVAGT